jgi:hypothetical protein
MEPRVRGMDYEWMDEEERVEDTREQELAKRRMLVETFGSQKSKMRVSQILECAIYIFFHYPIVVCVTTISETSLNRLLNS